MPSPRWKLVVDLGDGEPDFSFDDSAAAAPAVEGSKPAATAPVKKEEALQNGKDTRIEESKYSLLLVLMCLSSS